MSEGERIEGELQRERERTYDKDKDGNRKSLKNGGRKQKNRG